MTLTQFQLFRHDLPLCIYYLHVLQKNDIFSLKKLHRSKSDMPCPFLRDFKVSLLCRKLLRNSLYVSC
jgi:hypothetical protein